jgi:RNA ligase
MTNLMNNIDILDLHADGMHPAVSYEFDELVRLLRKDMDDNRVNSRTMGNYELFDYNSYGIFDAGWSRTALIARGLVVNHKLGKVVAYPFPKFFNWGEVTEGVPDEPFTAYEKLDGSMGIAFWESEKGFWQVNTRGSFESDQSKWATKWLNEREETTAKLVKGDTYLFEIIYPENKIVIPYSYTGLSLIGAYTENGSEYEDLSLEFISSNTELRSPMIYAPNSIENLLKLAKGLPVYEEGWVLKFASGYRVKIKGDEYCRVHRLISNCTPITVWENYVAMEDFEALKKDLPEEFRSDLDNMVKIFDRMFDAKYETVAMWIDKTHDWTNKGIGLGVSHGEIPKEVSKWLFTSKKEGVVNFTKSLNSAGDVRRKFLFEFRPKNNVLEGYYPTTAMNRFEVDAS